MKFRPNRRHPQRIDTALARAATVQWLQQGIAANRENDFLNHDMQLLVDKTLEQMKINQQQAASESHTHLLMRDYEDNSPQAQAFDAAADPTHPTRH